MTDGRRTIAPGVASRTASPFAFGAGVAGRETPHRRLSPGDMHEILVPAAAAARDDAGAEGVHRLEALPAAFSGRTPTRFTTASASRPPGDQIGIPDVGLHGGHLADAAEQLQGRSKIADGGRRRGRASRGWRSGARRRHEAHDPPNTTTSRSLSRLSAMAAPRL